MSTMSDTIRPKDLVQFPRPVAKVLTDAINKHGVGYRLMDGGHIRLFCGDRQIVPIKVSASRDAEHTIRYLVPWLEEHVESWLQGEVTPDVIKNLAELKNSRPVPATPVVSTDSPASDEPTGEQKPSTPDGKGEAMSAALKIPADLVCQWPDCGKKMKNTSGYRMHWAGHTGEKRQHAAKGAETARLRRSQESAIALAALTAIADLHGITIGGSKALEKKVSELEAKVATLTRERDDAIARVELLNEAFKGLT